MPVSIEALKSDFLLIMGFWLKSGIEQAGYSVVFDYMW